MAAVASEPHTDILIEGARDTGSTTVVHETSYRAAAACLVSHFVSETNNRQGSIGDLLCLTNRDETYDEEKETSPSGRDNE